jgi:hypothetical protein
MSSDMWFENFERSLNELEGYGLSFDRAYHQAAVVANGAHLDLMIDGDADHDQDN